MNSYDPIMYRWSTCLDIVWIIHIPEQGVDDPLLEQDLDNPTLIHNVHDLHTCEKCGSYIFEWSTHLQRVWIVHIVDYSHTCKECGWPTLWMIYTVNNPHTSWWWSTHSNMSQITIFLWLLVVSMWIVCETLLMFSSIYLFTCTFWESVHCCLKWMLIIFELLTTL